MDDDFTINFYLPYQKEGVVSIPDRIEDYWSWIINNKIKGDGKYTWTLQTYLYLKETEIPCKLVLNFPKKGIVIAHKDFLPIYHIPRPDVFLVCIKPDRKEHSCAHHYLVQNNRDKIFEKFGPDKVTETPHWAQPSLIKRNSERADNCLNVAYIGRLMNLARELQVDTWKIKLEKMGFHWIIVPKEKWNDYSEIDLTVSVRSFGNEHFVQGPLLDPDSKPPSKVINSWLAGVPAIVGRESAYQGICRNALDFIEVDTPEQLIEVLVKLRENKELYRKMVVHGIDRAKEYSAEELISKWRGILEEKIYPTYRNWVRLSKPRRLFYNIYSLLKYLMNKRNISDLIHLVLNEIRTRIS